MKKIFRKNQLVITALALMIAVAGYFSYMNNNMEDDQVTAEASADARTSRILGRQCLQARRLRTSIMRRR